VTVDFTLQIRRTIDAPPATVFELLSGADEIRRWFGPKGYAPTQVDLDLRVGGAYRITMRPPEGDDFHIRGTFTDVVRPERLAFTFAYEEPGPDDLETVVTMEVRPVAAGTTDLTVEQRGFATEERLELHRGGWADSLERLAAVVASRA